MKDAPQRVQQFWQTIDCGVALEDESGSIQVDSPIGSLCSHPPAITPAIRFLRLNEAEWHGKIDSLGSIMLVRECYPRMWSLIKQRSKEGLRYFGILGDPGIGKTVLGLFILRELKIEKDVTIVYQSWGQRVFKFGWDENNMPHVWSSKDVDVFREDLESPSSWYIVDGLEPIIIETGARTILITSSDPKIYKRFLLPPTMTLYMDRWSDEEMSALKAKCYPSLAQDDYDDLLMRYGPIPRWILEQTTSSPRIQWYSHIEKAPSYTDLSSLTASSTPSIPLSANTSSLPPGKQKKSGKVVRKNEEGGMEADSGSISGIRAIGVFHFSLGNQRNFPLSPPFLVPHVTLPNNSINSLRMRLRNSPCPKL